MRRVGDPCTARAECIDSTGMLTSTVRMPRRVAMIGPTVLPHGTVFGVRAGKAMVATLRHDLIRVPARILHAGALPLRLPPGHELLNEVLAPIRALPAAS